MAELSIGCIILAAGGSTRMDGNPKQLLQIKDRSLLTHTISTVLNSRCDTIVVVLGHCSEECQRIVSQELGHKEQLHFVDNTHWQSGMGSSIKAGLQTLNQTNPNVDATMVILCDQPRLTSANLDSLINKFETSHPLLVASEYPDLEGELSSLAAVDSANKKLGVPVLFSKFLFPELMMLDDSHGAKKIIYKHRNHADTLPFSYAHEDIDTLEDYRRVCQQLSL